MELFTSRVLGLFPTVVMGLETALRLLLLVFARSLYLSSLVLTLPMHGETMPREIICPILQSSWLSLDL